MRTLQAGRRRNLARECPRGFLQSIHGEMLGWAIDRTGDITLESDGNNAYRGLACPDFPGHPNTNGCQELHDNLE